MKKKMFTICIGLLFLAALCLTLYPLISNYVNYKYASQIHTAYQEVMEQIDDSALREAKEQAEIYFRYIDKLKVGDMVSITNLWETLTYRVCEIKIIDPHDVTEILIQPGRELLTLLTCHPYASGGRQRYVVYCERVESSPVSIP